MKNRPLHLPQSIAGYTLVELLVAMLIGLFLLAGAFQITQANKRNNVLQKSIQQVQKDGRFAVDHLTYAIKTAGYSGFYESLFSNVENLLNTPTDIKWDVSIPVSGYNDVANADSIAGITNFKEDTDVLLIKGMGSNTASVLTNVDSSNIVTEVSSNFTAGDIVLVSDPDQASLLQVSSITNSATTSTLTLASGAGTPGNSALLNNSFNSDSEISKYDVQMFYIKIGRNGFPALFKTMLINKAGTVSLQENELVSDIKDMQISYGIDNNNDQILDAYDDASAITDWNQVVSVKLVLLASSNKDNVVPKKSSFSFDVNLVSFVKDAVAATDGDRRLKRVFRTSVPLRN